MTIMDHNEAVRLQAAEKYLLGELPKEQHAAYEEHFFDCPACAEDLKTTVAFMGSSRQVVREAVPETIDVKRVSAAAGGWFAWFRPAIAVPVFAVLVLLIGYQNSVTIPGLKRASSSVILGKIPKSFSLMTLGTRGEGSSSLPINVGAHEDFGLEVDMPGNSSSGYVCQIQDQSGKVWATISVSAAEAKSTVTPLIRGGSLRPGKYNFVIFTGQTPPPGADNRSAVAQKSFAIEFVE
jgi:Putative zinc-finger